MYLIKIFSALQNDLKYASNERILLEVAMLKLCSITEEKNIDDISAKLAAIERKIERGIPSFEPAPAKQIKKTSSHSNVVKHPPVLSQDRKEIKEAWKDMVQEIESPSVKGVLSQVSLEFKEETDQNMYLVCDYPALQKLVKKYIDFLQQKTEEYFHKSVSFSITTQQEYNEWYRCVYGETEQKTDDDAEFESLTRSYFPEAEFQE